MGYEESELEQLIDEADDAGMGLFAVLAGEKLGGGWPLTDEGRARVGETLAWCRDVLARLEGYPESEEAAEAHEVLLEAVRELETL